MALNSRSNLRSIFERGDRESCTKVLNRLSPDLVKEELRHIQPRRGLLLCSWLESAKLNALLAVLDRSERQRLLSTATSKELSNLCRALPIETLAKLTDELPARLSRDILDALPSKTKKQLEKQLPWPAYSVGLIMTKGWITLSPNMKVAEAIDKIRDVAATRETAHSCFVLGEDRHFIGSVPLEDLVLADPDEQITELLDPNPCDISPLTEQDEAARLMSKYDRDVLPVVLEGRMVGILTFDDVLDLIDQDNTELFLQMGGLYGDDEELTDDWIVQVKKRLPCLLLCLLTGVMTTSLLNRFEEALSAVVALTFFVPLLIDTGGNTGAQASTLVIRSMALNQLPDKTVFKVVLREICTGLLLGCAMAVLAVGRAWMLKAPVGLWFVIALAMIAVVTLANIIGTLLPFIIRKAGFDPAFLSGPLLSSIVDVTGLAVYLAIATKLLL